MHRLYENNEIVIFWNSDKCFHSTKCIQASPLTFDVNRKPWIRLSNAPNPEVWKAVELNCTTDTGQLKVEQTQS